VRVRDEALIEWEYGTDISMWLSQTAHTIL
jgi:hypothetical protein